MSISKETRKTLWWMLFIVLAAVLTVFFLYPRYQHLRKNQQELKQRRTELAERKIESEKLRKNVDDLKNSKEAVERVAREKFNMARPNETVMLVSEKEPRKEK